MINSIRNSWVPGGKSAMVSVVSLAGLLLVAVAPPVQAQKAKLEISGQINAALLFGGDVTDPEIVDNTASGSRLRLRGSSKAFGGLDAFMRYEVQAQENQSFGDVDSSESFDTRYAEVGVKGPFGSLSLGKGDGASNATAEASYQVSGNLFGGGHLPVFTVAGTLNRDNTAQVGWTYYDGFSRLPRLRYDTPSFGGFTAALSLGSQDRNEVALRYRGAIGPGRATVNFGLGDSADGGNDRTMLSFGYRLNSGVSFAYSFNDRTRPAAADLESQLLSLNYQLGKWIVSADYGDQGVSGENKVKSVGFQYNESKELSLYGAYIRFDNGDNSALDTFFVGSRYRFSL